MGKLDSFCSQGSTGAAISVDEEVKWTGIASAAAGACGTAKASALLSIAFNSFH